MSEGDATPPPRATRLFEVTQGRAEARDVAEQDRALLERARAHWQMGEWPALAALAREPLDDHPDRTKLALLAAVGLAQGGDLPAARAHAARARDWGCDRTLLAQVLIAGVHNSLGRAASLRRDEDRALHHFETSVATVTPHGDVKVLGRARNIHEKARLGQLPQAAKLMGEDLDRAGTAPPPAAELARLRTRLAQLERRAGIPDAASGPDALPDRAIYVCCHHKTGTNFLLPVFKQIAAAHGLPLWLKFYDAELESWRICLHQHSRLADLPSGLAFRGLHLVRHPMSLIHSATLYHARGSEPWLNIPLERFTGRTFWHLSNRDSYNVIKDPEVPMARKRELLASDPGDAMTIADFDSGHDFGGRTYAEMLHGMDRIEDRIAFEMSAYSRGVLRDMLDFPGDRRFFHLQLEDVSHDRSMAALRELFAHLGFGGEPAARCLEIAARHCLWNIAHPDHATTGVSHDWEPLFRGKTLQAFRDLFGWAERWLGYD
ncbi:hypothetical protein [Maricaulis sp.]|uniref:hypothetical protein n=1 Tax=Maricaulis sp. TaxID=1486257 RepID=UPI00261672CD|nr:hypothetical protein [Maricaulis sp.]